MTRTDRWGYWATRGVLEEAPGVEEGPEVGEAPELDPDRPWTVVRTGRTLVLAAPVDGLELYVESAALRDADHETIGSSVEAALLSGVVASASEIGGLDAYLDDCGYAVLEVSVPDTVGAPWRTPEGTAGALVAHDLGSGARIGDSATVVPVIGLHAEDARIALTVGEYAVEPMLAALQAHPDPTVTSADRPSLVPDEIRAECVAVLATAREYEAGRGAG